MFHSFVRCACLGIAAALTACSSVNNASVKLVSVVTPHKIDIVQGNFVSREQAAAIKVGMTRMQVRDVLGTSLLSSVFHANRWDYVFTVKRQGIEPQARRVTILFKDDVVAKIEADSLPTEAEFVASMDSGRTTGVVPMLEMSAQSLQDATTPIPAPLLKSLPPLPASYPPLEAPTR